MSRPQQPLIGSAREQLAFAVSVIKRAARRWWIIALFIMVGTGLAVGLAVMRPRQYQSKTVLLYREGVDRSYIQGNEGGGRPDTEDVGMRLREVLTARPRMEAVINEFGLAQRTLKTFGIVEAVEEVKRSVTFQFRGDTVQIAFTSGDPDIAQKVTDRLAQMLIEEDMRMQLEQAEETKTFLETSTKQAQQNLTERSRAHAEFLARHPEFATESFVATGAAVRAANRRGEGTGTRDPVVSRLEAQRDRVRRLLASAEGGSRQIEVAIDPALVQERDEAQQEVARARAALADAQARYTDAHPDVKAARADLREAEARLGKARDEAIRAQAAASGWRKTVTVDRASIERELEGVERSLSNARTRSRKEGEQAQPSNDTVYQQVVNTETEFARLTRELTAAQEEVEQIETIEFRAELAANSVTRGSSAKMVVIDPAFRPTRPSGMGRTVIVGIGAAVAMALGSILVLGLALLDDRFYGGDDVERAGLTALLIVVPRRGRRR